MRWHSCLLLDLRPAGKQTKRATVMEEMRFDTGRTILHFVKTYKLSTRVLCDLKKTVRKPCWPLMNSRIEKPVGKVDTYL